MPVIASVLLGFIPMLIFAGFVYWMDRFEKEPKFLLGFVFIWGALVAAGVAFVLNTIFGSGVFILTNSEIAADFSTGAISAPIIEESMKGLAVLIIFFIAYNEFDSILDGIVYAAMVALGFAATENAFYIYNFGYLESGWSGIFELFFIRVFLVGWQHPFYTAFIGIGLAIARVNKAPFMKITAPILGWIVAVTLHSIHNIIATVANGPVALLLGTSLDWLGWLSMLVFIFIVILRERKLISMYLGEISQRHPQLKHIFDSVTNLSLRMQYRTKYLGTKKYRIYNRFLQLSAELVHKLHQQKTVEKRSRYAHTIQELQNELQAVLIQLND